MADAIQLRRLQARDILSAPDGAVTVTTRLASSFRVEYHGRGRYRAFNRVEFGHMGGSKVYDSLPALILDLDGR